MAMFACPMHVLIVLAFRPAAIANAWHRAARLAATMVPKGRPMDSLRNDEVAAALLRLAVVVDSEFPRSYYRGEGEWPVIAAGHIARMAEIARSAALLIQAHAQFDAYALARVMYEQMVTYCWIAVEPTTHIRRWKDAAEAEQLKAHEEAKRYWFKMLTGGQARRVNGKEPLSVEQMAREADNYWSPRIEGFRVLSGKKHKLDLLTITGLYLGIYRTSSRIVHAQVHSLESVLRQVTGTKVVVERRAAHTVSFAPTIVPLFAMAIEAHHTQFNWPDVEKVREINNALLWEG